MTSTPADPWRAVFVGRTFAEYEIVEPLGSPSGFSLVYRARHILTGQPYALKVLHPLLATGDNILDFDNEGHLLRRLERCNNIVRLVHRSSENIIVTLGGQSLPILIEYLVLKLADGSLNELVRDPIILQALRWSDRLKMWRDAVRGIHQMHSLGMAHRDLKSDNCLVKFKGQRPTVWITDLGRSKDLAISTRHHLPYETGRGDLRFAPPEAILAQAGHAPRDFYRSDYYGLGSLLIELATGSALTMQLFQQPQLIVAQAKFDASRGVTRDISALAGRQRMIVMLAVEQMPRSIREDATIILNQLCASAPEERLLGSPFSRDRNSRDALEWVMRRAEIMYRRVLNEERVNLRATTGTS